MAGRRVKPHDSAAHAPAPVIDGDGGRECRRELGREPPQLFKDWYLRCVDRMSPPTSGWH